MCLLFSAPSNKLRDTFLNTPGLIDDVYQSNADGFGFMYHTKTGVKVVKRLPRNADDVRKMFAALPNDDRMVAGHARMRTHGDINKEQVHPYPIAPGAWLMHNGILSTGNKADTSKSDTWHFAKEYLSTLSADTLHNPQFLTMLGGFIDNNRFVIMTDDGRMSWVNAHQGVQHDGIQFSNTYAWSPSLLIPGYRDRYAVSHTNYPAWATGGLNMLDDAEGLTPSEFARYADYDLSTAVYGAIAAFDEELLADLFKETPVATLDTVLDEYDIAEYERFKPADNTKGMCRAVRAWCDYDRDTLRRVGTGTLVHALLYGCNLVHESEADPVPTPTETLRAELTQ